MIEIEKTYLAKRIPANIKDCKHKEIIDIYFPGNAVHPQIRLRKESKEFVLTKKSAPEGDNFSKQMEQTIILSEPEYNEFAKLNGKRSHKIRYYYDYKGREAQIDVFKDALEGLVLVDFEFESEEEEKRFSMPDFCLAEVTQEEFAAGGMLCGKSYMNIEAVLKRFNYQKLFFD
jgi:CYTH domain-containing protein